MEATTAVVALELIEKHAIDLLLTDVVMPEMNGLELAQQVSKRWPNLRILFMSGYAGDRVRGVTLIDDGAYLEKPLTRRKLLEHIARLLTPNKPASAP